jgi:hypothetical protein
MNVVKDCWVTLDLIWDDRFIVTRYAHAPGTSARAFLNLDRV